MKEIEILAGAVLAMSGAFVWALKWIVTKYIPNIEKRHKEERVQLITEFVERIKEKDEQLEQKNDQIANLMEKNDARINELIEAISNTPKNE